VAAGVRAFKIEGRQREPRLRHNGVTWVDLRERLAVTAAATDVH
jgi:hypothetical protein